MAVGCRTITKRTRYLGETLIPHRFDAGSHFGARDGEADEFSHAFNCRHIRKHYRAIWSTSNPFLDTDIPGLHDLGRRRLDLVKISVSK
jgi:hypothetical protein